MQVTSTFWAATNSLPRAELAIIPTMKEEIQGFHMTPNCHPLLYFIQSCCVRQVLCMTYIHCTVHRKNITWCKTENWPQILTNLLIQAREICCVKQYNDLAMIFLADGAPLGQIICFGPNSVFGKYIIWFWCFRLKTVSVHHYTCAQEGAVLWRNRGVLLSGVWEEVWPQEQPQDPPGVPTPQANIQLQPLWSYL